jgi:type I restriction enzyme S subunit
VDFDPVRAKSAGKLPDGIDEATTALFPDSFEQSELGEIPKGWKISNIGSELTTILGGTPSRERPEFWNDGVVSWINSGKVNEFRITTASELITEEALLKSATKLLPARTTVIAITGATLGQVSIVEIEACTNQSVVGLIQNEKFSTEYIYFWINFNIKKLISSQTGGAQQHINKGNVEDLHLLVPNIKILNKFKSISQPLFLKVAENCFQINTLRNIRGTLLPRLISGQLGLPDLEEINNKTKVNA